MTKRSKSPRYKRKNIRATASPVAHNIDLFFASARRPVASPKVNIAACIHLAMAQTLALIRAAFPADIARLIHDYFRPRRDGDAYRVAKAGAYERCANILEDSCGRKPIEGIMVGGCAGGHKKIVKLAYFSIVKRGGTLLPRCWNKCLRGACQSGIESLIDFAIMHGADDWTYGMNGAAKAGNLELFERMYARAKAEKFDVPSVINMSWLACRGGNMDIIKIVYPFYESCWELGFVCTYRHMAPIHFAIEKGARDWDRGLCSACRYGHIDTVMFLIEKGATAWDDGLREATLGDHIEIMRLMLEKGAATTDSLKYACGNNSVAAIQLLIDHGAHDWNDALHYISGNGDMRAVIMMVEHGATNLKESAIAALENNRPDVAAYLAHVLHEREMAAANAASSVVSCPPYHEIRACWRTANAKGDNTVMHM